MQFSQQKFTYFYKLAIVLISLCGGAFSAGSLAHDIPSRVTLDAYVKPQGEQLNVLLRVPMASLSEVNFPLESAGYLDLARADPAIEEAARDYVIESLRLYEDGRELENARLTAARVELPSDRSFTDYQSALDNVRSEPLDDSVNLYWSQGVLDVLVQYPIESQDSNFAFESQLYQLGMETNTVLRFVLPDGEQRVFNYLGDPGMVELDPGLFQSLWRFLEMGFFHILEGIDHLLFLFCLIIPLQRMRALIPIVTAFTVAHSITLMAAAFGLAPQVPWFPALIETLIALSIVYMACENIFGARMQHRWLMTFGFGLVHGFGFSFLLADSMQFAGSHLVSSLLAFNVGVELGQLLVLVVAVPLLVLFLRLVKDRRLAAILLSALTLHSAWHWMVERGAEFLQYEMQWPALDAAFFATLLRWVMLLMVAAATAWALPWIFRRLSLDLGKS